MERDEMSREKKGTHLEREIQGTPRERKLPGQKMEQKIWMLREWRVTVSVREEKQLSHRKGVG